MITPNLQAESNLNMSHGTHETWLDVAETNGLYEVSNSGRVRRKFPLRMLKPLDDHKGYLRINLSVNGNVTTRYIAHLVLETFIGSRPPANEARHLDGNSRNNALGNLAWGTKSDNMQDAIGHGTFPLLERRPGAKLTRDQVIAIFISSDSTTDISARYRINPGVVRQIKLRETWASVTANLPDADWKFKPKHSQNVIQLATDPTKTRSQAMAETGLSLDQIKRIRKLAGLNPS